MKKTILILGLALSLYSCSTDDTATVEAQQQEQLPNEENNNQESAYKLFLVTTSIDKELLTFKTKTGNDEWVEHELELWRFPVSVGDSVHVSSGDYYVPNENIKVILEMNTVVDWHDERNKMFQVGSYDRPLDKKIKIKLD